MDNGTPLSSPNSAMSSEEKKNPRSTFKIKIKMHSLFIKNRMIYCLRVGLKIYLCTKAIKYHDQSWSGHIISSATWIRNGLR